jgi:hypothetical protein
MTEPKPYSTWLHIKGASTYTVLGVSKCSTNGNESERAVIYISHTYGVLHHRELSEFMDGRFEEIT